jgi:biopolymer transport protein ExbB/TolQ
MEAWLIAVGWLEYLTMAVLLGLSVWSITIMIDRSRALKDLSDPGTWEKLKSTIESRNWRELGKVVENSPSLSAGALRAAIGVAGPEGGVEPVEHAVRGYMNESRLRLERGLAVLATLGSNAPFIGLFGTVLGIIQAFAVLGNQNGQAASVMSGVSRALFATAAGLFVAIPAVVAFNYFSSRIKVALSQCDVIRDLYLSRRLSSQSSMTATRE